MGFKLLDQLFFEYLIQPIKSNCEPNHYRFAELVISEVQVLESRALNPG
jgi:hypothetical protein